MVRDLTDRVIVITGASAGIGAAMAEAAAEARMHCVLAARREDKLEQVARRVRDAGREALVVAADVGKDDDVRRLVEQTVERFGRLDVMFANAGYGFLRPVADLSDDEHRQIFEANYFGTVRCIREALPIMQQAGRGHIVITSSIVGRVGLPLYAAYSATKAAQDALATALRVELEPLNIDLTAVYPIGTKTEFFEVSAKIGGRDAISENTPEAFMQSPAHVARRIVKALRRPCPEVWPARWSRYGAALACMFPRLTRWALRKHFQRDHRAIGGQ